ncbi:MAG TPA: SDR family NAD(P)-dependent oxidoreductase, partial [Solimonas sp.]|nr:SDR family NAD(P)-dependent oxidoreductase [Solimonas sp.]
MTRSPFDLRGKVALVTGGNRGIGLAMAEALAIAGADVAIWGTNAARNETVLAQLRQHGTRVSAAVVDVSDEAAVVAEMKALATQMGRIDTVVANAGIGVVPTPFTKQSLEQWRAVFAVNLEGAFLTLREAARHMQARAE